MSYIVEHDQVVGETLRATLGSGWRVLGSIDSLRHLVADDPASQVIVVGPGVDQGEALALAESLRVVRPELGIILVRHTVDAATLTDALRAGVRDVVIDQDPNELRAAAHRSLRIADALRDQAEAALDEDVPTGRLITVFAAKGGCGKTTMATNLAAALADGGRREVCLVDLDLAFGDVAIALQVFPAHTLADAVPLSETLDEAAVAGLITPHSPGLSTLVAPVEPGLAETIPAATIAKVLHLLKRMFPYVVVDTPPAFTDHVLASFDQSDVVALMATLDIPALKNLKLTLETLDLLNYPRDRWRVVLNRADSKVGLAVSEVEKTLKVPIACQIPSSRDVPASVNRGVPLMLDSPRHAVSEAIREFGEKHVIDHTQRGSAVANHLRTDRRGLLRRKART
ncbi:MAG: AAA family ATPase [Actinomycetota bacterium]|nr:AAA family ATPase [Actinomycetota bacterium]